MRFVPTGAVKTQVDDDGAVDPRAVGSDARRRVRRPTKRKRAAEAARFRFVVG
jgi:hypothetical protein